VNTFRWVLAGAAAGLAPWSVMVLSGWYYRVGGSWFEREVRRVRAGLSSRTVIKACGRDSAGRPVIFLGLTGENMTRLMADEPIRVDLADLGGPACVVVLIGGRTERAITEQFESRGMVPAGAAAKLAGDTR
jgi:hypothetical protein